RPGPDYVASKLSVRPAAEIHAADQVLPQRLADPSEPDGVVPQGETPRLHDGVPPGDEEQVRPRRRARIRTGDAVENHLGAPSGHDGGRARPERVRVGA